MIEPYHDALEEFITKILQMNSVSLENLCILIDGWCTLYEVSDVATYMYTVRITAINAASHAGVSALLMGGMVDTTALVYLIIKDLQKPGLT